MAHPLRPCPVCRVPADPAGFIGTLHKTVPQTLDVDAYAFAYCPCRELVYISPAPSPDALAAMYVTGGQFESHVYTAPEHVAQALAYMTTCFENLLFHSGRRADDEVAVLEVGAGLAWMCRAAKAKNPRCRTVAQDVSPEAVDRCPWVDAYLRAEVFDPILDRHAPFDVISLTHVIEHLVEPVDIVRRCKALLAPTGRILVTAPHRPPGWVAGSTDVGIWERFVHGHVPAHVQYFARGSMERLAERAGCRLVAWSEAHGGGQAFEAWLA